MEERSADSDDLPLRPGRTLPLALLVWIASVLVLSGVAAAVVVESGQTFSDLTGPEVFAATLPLQLGLFGGAILVASISRDPLRALRLDDVKYGEIAVSFGVGVLAQIVIIVAYSPFVWLFDIELDAAEELAAQFSGGSVMLLVLIAVVGAPVSEELFFRGLVQGSLEQTEPAWKAVGVTSLLFSVSHFQLLQAPGLLAFGLLLGWQVSRTGRIGGAIAMHAGFNSIGVYLAVG
ncbi:CPBP family intramembrane metalloprotease [Acidimicrobiaceae bacterium AH-315-P05]|nr:CPBP family intramembrane metalloprotease [Acidimicrobiaceae bacterium AH-315-P05]